MDDWEKGGGVSPSSSGKRFPPPHLPQMYKIYFNYLR